MVFVYFLCVLFSGVKLGGNMNPSTGSISAAGWIELLPSFDMRGGSFICNGELTVTGPNTIGSYLGATGNMFIRSGPVTVSPRGVVTARTLYVDAPLTADELDARFAIVTTANLYVREAAIRGILMTAAPAVTVTIDDGYLTGALSINSTAPGYINTLTASLRIGGGTLTLGPGTNMIGGHLEGESTLNLWGCTLASAVTTDIAFTQICKFLVNACVFCSVRFF